MAHVGWGGCGLQEPFGWLSVPPRAGQEPGATVSSFLLHVLGLQEKSPCTTTLEQPLVSEGPCLCSSVAPRRSLSSQEGCCLPSRWAYACIATASPFAWQNSAPEVGSFSRSVLPHSFSVPPFRLFFLLCVGEGSPVGTLPPPKCHYLKAKTETHLLLGDRLGPAGTSRLGHQ